MMIRNILKQNLLPFSIGYLLAYLIFISMDTYYAKGELERNERRHQERLEREDRYHQERLEREDRYHQEMMKRKKD